MKADTIGGSFLNVIKNTIVAWAIVTGIGMLIIVGQALERQGAF